MAEQRSADELAKAELHPAGTAPVSLGDAFSDSMWQAWTAQVKADPAYHPADPDSPDDGGFTNSAGSLPPKALIVQYGDGPHDYISTDFDAGQVIVRDGNDPTGRAWKFAEADWRRFVARLTGQEIDDPDAPKGPTQYEEARTFAARTAQHVQADQAANEAAAQGEDVGAARRSVAQPAKTTGKASKTDGK